MNFPSMKKMIVQNPDQPLPSFQLKVTSPLPSGVKEVALKVKKVEGLKAPSK